jgi:hypothetical protein
MPIITFNEWGFGLDLRKGSSTADANRLRVLTNAYITDGKTIRKRNGFTKVATLQPGTKGLFAGGGKLNTFQIPTPTYPPVAHPGGLLLNRELEDVFGSYDPTGTEKLADVLAMEMFNGVPYVAALHWYQYAIPGTYTQLPRHHFIDGDPGGTFVDDAPWSRSIVKAASKVWSADGDVVKFSKTNDPRDWTTPDDAGFLPVGLQQSGNKESITVGNYQNRLVVFFADSAQLWQVDPDPANHQFLTAVDIGTRLVYAHQNMSSDVFFMSPGGVRTITRQSNTESLIDSDVGSPIDRELLAGQFITLENAKAHYVRGTGQYWLYSGNTAVVFTFSRSSKISAWSIYEFSFPLDRLAELEAVLYVRSGDDVYRLDDQAWTDDGELYEVNIETAFADFKSPRVDKQLIALDAVFTGTGDLSQRFDPRSPDLITSPPMTISGDTQPGNTYPVELITTNVATVIRNHDAAEFEVHQFSYQYELLR